MELLRSYDLAYFFRQEAAKWASSVRALDGASAAETKTAELIERVLTQPWTHFRDQTSLVSRCISALTTKLVVTTPGTPEDDRLLCWCVLQELAYRSAPDGYSKPGNNFYYSFHASTEFSIDPKERLTFIAECRRVLGDGPDAERGFAASMLMNEAISANLVDTAETTRFVTDRDPSVWRWSALSLIRQGKRVALWQMLVKRSLEDQKQGLFMLAHSMPETFSAEELQYWVTYARSSPLSLAYACDLAFAFNHKP
ncbi:MAG TPA: hypothetical protein VEK08_25830, partial [Planctomycetota bacterium]|nr:hypothetical protein [Planctomycetota bacterium]